MISYTNFLFMLCILSNKTDRNFIFLHYLALNLIFLDMGWGIQEKKKEGWKDFSGLKPYVKHTIQTRLE